jgi:hypothetical protein
MRSLRVVEASPLLDEHTVEDMISEWKNSGASADSGEFPGNGPEGDAATRRRATFSPADRSFRRAELSYFLRLSI